MSKLNAASMCMQVLGKNWADGSPLLSVSELRDGIVTFEDMDDAERYGNLLEADGSTEVRIACLSHTLIAVPIGPQAVGGWHFVCGLPYGCRGHTPGYHVFRVHVLSSIKSAGPHPLMRM
jgi:hypothetical protein